MKNKQMIIWTLLVLLTLMTWGCGSSRDSSDSTTTTTPEAVIATASFVGSTQCLSCHGDKSNWGHTLHKAVLRAPNAFSAAQANTETFYAGTVNKGVKLSLGNDTAETLAVGGLNDAVTPNGEFVAYYNDGSSWNTHYGLGLGATATTGVLPATSGAFDLKYAAQIILSGGVYFVQFTELAVGGTGATARYKILFTYGGEGNYKQRNVLVADNDNQGSPLGASKHISPLQYNDKWSGYVDPTSPGTPDLNYKWVNYHGERWYDLGDSDLTTPGSKDSFDGNCAGCHFTGYKLAKNGGGEEIADAVDDINGAVDFDGDGKMDEINIGCEACHGAGSEHASTQNPAYIINPDNLTPAEANMVCGQCHIRGKSIDKFTEFAEASATSPAQAPFPAKLDADGMLMKFRPGLDDLATFYSFDSGVGTFDGQYWGSEPSGGTFQASSSHHQQYIDILQGPHAPDKSYDARCFDCHDLHDNASTGRHQIVTSITEDNVVVKTANDDNSLCLTCHAGHGPFAAVTIEDVLQINPNSAFNVLMDPVKKAVTAHTQHYYDPIKEDSASNGSSRCSRCHMPKTAKSALKYDIHAHTFNVIEPSVSLSSDPDTAGIPNACTSCHAAANDVDLNDLQAAFDEKFPVDPVTGAPLPPANVIFDQWAASGHADYAGEAFNHWNDEGEVSTSCAKCHSKDGFIDFAMDGTVDAAAKLGTTISCGACHIDGDSPDLYDVGAQTLFDAPGTYPEVANVAFPFGGATQSKGDASNICMNCHQGRESGASITAVTPVGNETGLSFINRHYFAAAAINYGAVVNAGYEYAGQTYVGEMTFPGHPATLDTCVECHLQGTENHTFEPDMVTCAVCHTGITDFEEIGLPFGTANIDYDGSGTGESFQGEIDGLKASLLTEMQAYASATLVAPIIYQAGAYPYFFNDTNANGLVDAGEAIYPNRYTDFDATLLRAAFNYHSAQDPCGDIHNYKYVIQTLYDSADDLDDGLLNGSATGTRP